MYALQLFTLVSVLYVVQGQRSEDPEKLKNWCMDSKYHKTEPGPEDSLHQQCSPWKNHSCCTANTTLRAHEGKLYSFNWDHCKPLSKQCKSHFIQDLCFVECEPNLGPWIQEVDMRTRNETPHDVPICASDCDAWFNDCKDEHTCVPNWLKDFIWKNGSNTCPMNRPCRTFKDMWKNASNFCEQIWDHSWRFTKDNEPCMRIWFNSTLGNPNVRVAEFRINQLQRLWSLNPCSVNYFFTPLILGSILISLLVFP